MRLDFDEGICMGSRDLFGDVGRDVLSRCVVDLCLFGWDALEVFRVVDTDSSV